MRTLNEWRRLRLLTVRDLAEKAGVATRTITEAEHGRTTPTLTTMRKLCAALDVQPGEVKEFAEALGLNHEGER